MPGDSGAHHVMVFRENDLMPGFVADCSTAEATLNAQ